MTNTVTFEHTISSKSHGPVPHDYEGVAWENIDLVGRKYIAQHDLGPGYQAVLHGNVEGYTIDDDQHTNAGINAVEGTFSITGGHFSSLDAETAKVTFTAYLNGIEQGTKTVRLHEGDGSVHFNKQFSHITALSITTPEGSNEVVGMDDLKLHIDATPGVVTSAHPVAAHHHPVDAFHHPVDHFHHPIDHVHGPVDHVHHPVDSAPHGVEIAHIPVDAFRHPVDFHPQLTDAMHQPFDSFGGLLA